MNIGDSVFVLYVDHQGHPAPLSLSYHATASRRLASSVNRHPPSSLTEVDSAYCPQCLSFHDATTASNLGYCPKPSCRLCPLCRSVAAVVVEKVDEDRSTSAECFYKCGRCDWNSKSCFLYTQVASVLEDGSVTLEELENASNELASQLKTRIDQRNQSAEDHYKSMLTTMNSLAKEQVKGLRSATNRYLSTVTRKRGLDGPEGWSVKALEASIDERALLYASANEEIIGGQELQSVSLEVQQPLNESLHGVSVDSILLQHNSGSVVESLDALLPLSIPLRPRKSRRCRAELAEGRPGILLKPKLNPLEGDSSLRTGHGQWWKKVRIAVLSYVCFFVIMFAFLKILMYCLYLLIIASLLLCSVSPFQDSSAIEVLPRVRVSIHASDDTRHAFLFKVSNPTLGIVQLRLAGSTYAGEPDWDDSTTLISPMLRSILVDPLTQVSVNAHLDTNVLRSIPATETCELEPAEDSFLELGKTTEDIPDDVIQWEAGDVLFDSKVSKDSPSTMRLVGKKKSVAWFELVLMEPDMTMENVYCAIALALQIQVGNGSWESSLIQTQHLKEGDHADFVSFDLVTMWEKLD